MGTGCRAKKTGQDANGNHHDGIMGRARIHQKRNKARSEHSSKRINRRNARRSRQKQTRATFTKRKRKEGRCSPHDLSSFLSLHRSPLEARKQRNRIITKLPHASEPKTPSNPSPTPKQALHITRPSPGENSLRSQTQQRDPPSPAGPISQQASSRKRQAPTKPCASDNQPQRPCRRSGDTQDPTRRVP